MKLLSLVALVALVAVTSGYDACSMKLVVPEDFSIFTKFSQMRGGRISQGMQAATGQFPFTARLEFLSTESLVICSGSLVSEKFVLGARHCVGDTVISSAAVALGSGDWDNPQQRVWISVFHWNANSAVDLAIFELHTTANFNINIQPIRLPRQSLTSVDNIIAFASEWGDTSTGFPKFVHFTTLRVLSNFECLKLHNNGWLDDSRMCAVGLTNSRQVKTYKNNSKFKLTLRILGNLWR